MILKMKKFEFLFKIGQKSEKIWNFGLHLIEKRRKIRPKIGENLKNNDVKLLAGTGTPASA